MLRSALRWCISAKSEALDNDDISLISAFPAFPSTTSRQAGFKIFFLYYNILYQNIKSSIRKTEREPLVEKYMKKLASGLIQIEKFCLETLLF